MTPSEIQPGMKFGHWEVIKFDHSNKHRIKYFLCKCDVCGNIRPVRGTALLNGTSTACSKACSASIIGQKFGRWTVLKHDTSRPRYVICRCDCGTIRSVFSGSLKQGATLSCGCYKGENTKVRYISLVNEYCNILTTKDANMRMDKLLTRFNIPFKKQYRFEDCKDKGTLPFDFALFNNAGELIGLIENNGDQHYSARGTQWNSPERLLYIQKHNYIKQKFAEDNHIPLLIIPYQYFEEKDMEKFLMTSDFWNIIIKNFND